MPAHFRSALVTLGGVVFFAGAVHTADWNPKLAAQYLDTRQQEWFAWQPAQSPDGPCVSCHTGMPYLLARPALRRLLKEKAPTTYETGLVARLQAHAGAKPENVLRDVETIFAAMFVTDADARQKTFDQLWALQLTDGRFKGGWRWYAANLDPWETPPAFAYGDALAALAVGSAPSDLHGPADAQDRMRALSAFLRTDYEKRPLHTRLAILWATTKVPDLISADARKATLDELLAKQQPDGGWTLESLGPWAEHAAAPPSLAPGASHAYATAFTAYVLKIAGGNAARRQTARASEWLKAHQDRRTGAWPAVSMNKTYPAGSMEEKFLQDAATAFAVLALTPGK